MNVETLQGTPSGATDQILSDHGNLRERLQGLEQHLWQPVDSVGEWLTTLREALHDLAEECRAHFRDEEFGGLHHQLRDHSPRLTFRLQRLVFDHPRILAALKDLAAHFPVDELMKRNELRSLKERVQSALEMVHAHERAETKVAMDAYWDDLGGESG